MCSSVTAFLLIFSQQLPDRVKDTRHRPVFNLSYIINATTNDSLLSNSHRVSFSVCISSISLESNTAAALLLFGGAAFHKHLYLIALIILYIFSFTMHSTKRQVTTLYLAPVCKTARWCRLNSLVKCKYTCCLLFES